MEFFLRAAIALFERETSFRFFKLYFSLSLSLSLSLRALAQRDLFFAPRIDDDDEQKGK
jgi:hypothetical protein